MRKRLHLTREILAGRTALLKKYTDLIKLELDKTTNNDLYALCFSRLLKENLLLELNLLSKIEDKRLYDTYGGVTMLGTDQRDYFAPKLTEVANLVKSPSKIIDIGAGDGKSSYFLLSRLESDVEISIIEPNEKYISSYNEMVMSIFPKASPVKIVSKTIDDFINQHSDNCDIHINSQDFCISLHSIYFTSNIKEFLRRGFEILSPGGFFIIVFADELDSFTGMVCSAFAEMLNKNSVGYRSKFNRRHQIFGIGHRKVNLDLAYSNLEGIFGSSEFRISKIERQPSRFFGNDFGDIIASAFLTDLPSLERSTTSDKVEFVSKYILNNPTDIDLCLELQGPRRGMISVKQPQYFICIRKNQS
jgi:SAM-dependent methyltransferase